MEMRQLVKAALEDKNPKLYKALKAEGTLNEYVAEIAKEASSQIVTLTQAQRMKEKWDKLGPMECAARIRAADAENLRVVMADLLEFPQDETSLQNQDETTPLDPTI